MKQASYLYPLATLALRQRAIRTVYSLQLKFRTLSSHGRRPETHFYQVSGYLKFLFSRRRRWRRWWWRRKVTFMRGLYYALHHPLLEAPLRLCSTNRWDDFVRQIAYTESSLLARGCTLHGMGTHSCVIFTNSQTNDKEIYTVLVGLICIYTCWDTSCNPHRLPKRNIYPATGKVGHNINDTPQRK